MKTTNLANEENWAARERLRRVEFLLWWRGWVGRGDLADTFGVSPAQSSGDLQRYAALNPDSMVYHTSRKRYESVPNMVCRLHEPSFDEAIRVLLGGGGTLPPLAAQVDQDPRLAMISLPRRTITLTVARRMMIALMGQRKIRVTYASLSSAKEEARDLSPRAMAWDRDRWHARAWCGQRNEWRDFVLGRIIKADWPKEDQADLPEDTDWNTFETVRLRLNQKLDAAQQDALRHDYDLKDDVLKIKVRRAMKPYLLANLWIDEDHRRDLPRHFTLDT